jgi:hypothetical protein
LKERKKSSYTANTITNKQTNKRKKEKKKKKERKKTNKKNVLLAVVIKVAGQHRHHAFLISQSHHCHFHCH